MYKVLIIIRIHVCSQAYNLKIPHYNCVYELRGVIVYDHLLNDINHYRAFFRSLKDPTKWFHANDSMVSKNILNTIDIVIPYHIKVTLVSIASVLQQHPFLLFYELNEGIHM